MIEKDEVVVYKTADLKLKKLVESKLVSERISYLERWEKVPFLKRKMYEGAKEVCVIFCDKYQKKEAEEIVAQVTGQTLHNEVTDTE
ncbi:MAG: hypothetical protein ACI4HI_15170 [Lachnospiraceae bacterium]